MTPRAGLAEVLRVVNALDLTPVDIRLRGDRPVVIVEAEDLRRVAGPRAIRYTGRIGPELLVVTLGLGAVDLHSWVSRETAVGLGADVTP